MVMEKLIKAKAATDAAKRKKTAGPGSTSTPGAAANDDSSISFSEWNKSADSSNTSLNTSVTKFVGITSPNPVGSGGGGGGAASGNESSGRERRDTADLTPEEALHRKVRELGHFQRIAETGAI